MAVTIFTNGMAIVGGTDLSDHVTSITTTDDRDAVDVTAMGATSKQIAKGLGDASIEIEFLQDDAAGKVHATLSPLIGSTTPIAVEVRRNNAARAATGQITCLLAAATLTTYSGLDGNIGDALKVKAMFVNYGAAGMTYPTS